QNETIPNTEDLEPLLEKELPIPGSTTDTKLAGYRLLQHYRAEHDWTRAFHKLSKELNGSYSFVMIAHEGEVQAARDEAGYRPLWLGYDTDTATHSLACE